MIAANRFVINHMNPSNLKIIGLILKSIALLRRGLPNLVGGRGAGFCRGSYCNFEQHQRSLQSVLKYTVTIVFIVGVLGCQRSKDHSETKEVREGKVVGGSMAPNFLGEHFSFRCESCNSKVVTDFAQSKKRDNLICPYCGTARSLASCRQQNSDRVKLAVGSQEVQRWDVVAFQAVPEAAGIKRVVGLPGETILIRGGNLWREGKLIQKSIRDQKRTRILIHDSRNTRPASAVWQAVDSAGVRPKNAQHRFENRRFNFEAHGQLQWFQFCNQRNYAHSTDSDSPLPDEEIQAWPIEDSYGYNQTLARNLNVVDEVFVSLKFLPVVTRRIVWSFINGSDAYEFAIDVERKELAVSKLQPNFGSVSGQFQHVKLADGVFGVAEVEVEFSTIDKLAVVLVGGTEATRFQLDSEPAKKGAERSGDLARRLFKLGAEVVRGAEQSPISHVQIWRDIYYLVAEEHGGQSQTLVADPDGFLLLGDNQPVSVDSRHWPDASVSQTDMIAIVRK